MKKLLLILFIALLVVALFLFRVPLTQMLSPNIAKYYGFDVSNFEVTQIDIDKIVIPLLAMQYDEAGKQVSIEIHDLEVNIDQYQRVISEVNSSHVSITIDEIGDSVAAKPNTSINDAINFLPIFGINIEHLEFKYHVNDNELASFKGELLYANDMQLMGVFSSQEEYKFDVSMMANDANFIVDVSKNNQGIIKEVVALKGDYWQRDNWLEVVLAGDVSVTTINDVLHGLGVGNYVQDDKTAIKAKFELDLDSPTQHIMQSFASRDSHR